jgi:hypothetical protein
MNIQRTPGEETTGVVQLESATKVEAKCNPEEIE